MIEPDPLIQDFFETITVCINDFHTNLQYNWGKRLKLISRISERWLKIYARVSYVYHICQQVGSIVCQLLVQNSSNFPTVSR